LLSKQNSGNFKYRIILISRKTAKKVVVSFFKQINYIFFLKTIVTIKVL